MDPPHATARTAWRPRHTGLPQARAPLPGIAVQMRRGLWTAPTRSSREGTRTPAARRELPRRARLASVYLPRARSEYELQSYLVDACRSRAENPAEVLARHVGFNAGPLCMVERIERFEPELQPRVTCELDVLEERHVPVIDAGPAQRVAPDGAETAGSRLGERRRVEPCLLARAESAGIRVTHQIGAGRAEAVVEATGVVRLDRNRESALERRNAVALPAADDRVLHAARVPAEFLAAAERKVVDEAPDQPVIDVEIGSSAIRFGVVVVQQPLPAVERRGANARGGRLAVDAPRPRVDNRRHERAGVPFQLRIERVVGRVSREIAVDVDLEI